MRVVIINCFDTYQKRVDTIFRYFVQKKYTVTVVTSNFRHIQKVHIADTKENYEYLEVQSYSKNISLQRIISHSKFSKDAAKRVAQLNPDVIWVLVPPNSLCKEINNYKHKNTKVTVIYDFIDMWPETMPIRKFEQFPLYKYWQNIRNNNIKEADAIVVECDYYKEVLKSHVDEKNILTLYLAKDFLPYTPQKEVALDRLEICYVGSINNLLDIPLLIEILEKIRKDIVFHIIGTGEKKDILIEMVNNAGIKVEDHGEIYDLGRKREILEKCHFGMNIMKKEVFVGLTMKSIDYFENGVPIINNIPGDTKTIVEDWDIGINVTEQMLSQEYIKIDEKFYELETRKRVRRMFEEYFTMEANLKRLDAFMKYTLQR